MSGLYNDIVRMMQDGGFFMWPILLCFVLGAAICFERLFYVMFRANINATAFMAQVQKLVMANNIDRAIKLCNAEAHAVLPKVVKAGLTRANLNAEDISSAVDEAVLEVGPMVSKRTGYLGMLANVSTLLGLLGTIWGLIYAFDAVARASAETKAQLLASGIAVAMYTTAGGLMSAIPIMVVQSVIQNTANKILDDVDQFGLKTVNLLVARKRGTLGQAAEG